MRYPVEMGGVCFLLDPAAVSAVRYRAEYGESVVNHLGACSTLTAAEPYLLRMCHQMIPPEERPGLEDFARLARRDRNFISKALTARDVLLAPDSKSVTKAGEGTEFDEYDVLALMAAAGVDLNLLYELPILHLASIVRRCFELKNPEHKSYRKMTGKELATLYPKQRKEDAHGTV